MYASDSNSFKTAQESETVTVPSYLTQDDIVQKWGQLEKSLFTFHPVNSVEKSFLETRREKIWETEI